MSKDKYYTPTIKEFCVGFEYEAYNNADWYWQEDKSGWVKCTRDEYNSMTMPLGQISGAISKDWIRVKYLDQEDIESLGFVKIDEPQSVLEECYEKDGLVIQTNPFIHENLSNKTRIGHRNLMRDGSGRYKGFYNYFQGTIKNKSELERVLEMIGYGQ